jgi:putative PIN family toxin of toxin-antitoxin system
MALIKPEQSGSNVKVFQTVIDTCVIVSAVRSRNGASFRLLSLLGDTRWQFNLSAPLVFEYEGAVLRIPPDQRADDEAIDELIDSICALGNHRTIYFLWRPMLSDPSDDFVLELAVESQSDCIITHNRRHFKGAETFGLTVVTPAEFLRLIGEIS